MANEVVGLVLAVLQQFEQCGGDGLFALERQNAWSLSRKRAQGIRLLEVGHGLGLNKPGAAVVLEQDKIFV